MSAMMQQILEKPAPKADRRIAYGNDALQFGDLRLPQGKGKWPLVVNIHGGFWKAAYDLEHNGHMCEALRAKGVATWSLEYRRIGNEGGGWPGTYADVKAGAVYAKTLAREYAIDLQRVIVMGHSAGGHLALLAGQDVKWLKGVISLSGVADLRRAHELKLSQGIVAKFLGATPEEAPERYREASPIERVPVRKPVVLIHGEEDKIVPIEIARGYAEASRKAGGKVELDVVPGGHFEVIDPETEQWKVVEKRVVGMLG
jgi:acetyl esterase/lipase